MRSLALLAALVLAAPAARAEGFAELAGGIMIPLGNDNWTNLVDTSPKLAARAGAIDGDVGGLLDVDWTPVKLTYQNNQFASASGHRFRILPHVVFHHAVAAKVAVGARFGAGVDIAHSSVDSVLGSRSDTNVGFAAEFAGGMWFRVGSTELGFEIGLPIGYHSKKAALGEISFDYTSYDLDLLFGIRLR